MRKVILSICILLSLTLVGCEPSGSGGNTTIPPTEDKPVEDKPTCQHEYVEIVVDSTCEEYGYIEYTCTQCGDNYIGKHFDYLLDHEFSDWNYGEGNCDDVIVDSRYCVNCGYEELVHKGPFGHKFNIVNKMDPTCFNDGFIEYKCENCEHSYTEYIKTGGHSYGEYEIVTPASCLNDGLKVRKCHCGHQEEKIIPMGEHNYSDGVCTSCGKITYLSFELNSETNTYYVSDCDNSVSVVNIPSMINNVLVTGIKYDAFMGCDKITHVVMPDTINYIGNSAFRSCINLVSVKLSKNITKISDGCFYSCHSLTEVEIHNGITDICMNAFFDSGIIEVVLPDSVKVVDNYAFGMCVNLKSCIIPSSVETLGRYVFDACSNLESITVPFIGRNTSDKEQKLGYLFSNYSFDGSVSVKPERYSSETYYIPSKLTDVVVLGGDISDYCFANVTTIKNVTVANNIGSAAFSGTTSLKNVTINNCLNIGSSAFNGCDKLEVLSINSNGIGEIAASAFKNCKGLIEVVINASIDSIGNNAFENCVNLNTVEFSSLKTLGNSAFAGCISLENIYLPMDLVSIGTTVFNGCVNVRNIVVPFIGYEADYTREFFFYQLFGGVSFTPNHKDIELTITNDENIYNYVLQDFKGISKITLSENTKTIGYGAFRYMADLKEVVLPDSIVSIEDSAFSNCINLVNINIPKNLTRINAIFGNCMSLTDIYIPEGVEYISGFSFTGITSIKLPSTLKEIGFNAFAETGLTSIEIPYGVSTIGSGAFSYTKLESLIIPDSVSSIGNDILYHCKDIKSLTVPFVGANIDDTEGNLVHLFGYYEPQNLTYLKITKGKYLYQAYPCIKELELNEYFHPTNSTFYYPLEKLTIGFNALTEGRLTYNSSKIDEIVIIGEYVPSYYLYNVVCDKIIVSETVEKVDDYAFSSSTVKEVIFLGDEVELGESVFGYCYNLKNLTIPDLNNYTVVSMFANFFNLENLTLTNISYIPIGAFVDCYCNIIILGDSLVEICGSAFEYYAGDNITIPSSVKKIGEYAFGHTDVNIIWDNPTIEVLEKHVFTNYLGKSVVVPNSVKKIEEYAFSGYSGVVDLSLLTELEICDYGFGNYHGSQIDIPSFVNEIGYGAFDNYSGVINFINPTIKEIKTGTFAGYMGSELVIPSSVSKINENAIIEAKNLLKLTVPFVGSELDGTNNYQFAYIIDELYSLKELVVLNGSIIRNATFEDCGLETIILPKGLTTIESKAFKEALVQKLVIPSSVVTIESGALINCHNLVDLTIPFAGTSDKDSLFMDLFEGSVSENGYQYKDQEYVFGMIPTYLETITINGKEIKDYAFFGLENLVEINICDTVKYIGYGAFEYCNSLTSVNYYGSIDEWCMIDIKSSPMQYADYFKWANNGELVEEVDVYVNSSVINSNSFAYMNFSSVTLGNNVTTVNGYAFKGYSGEILFDNCQITKFADYAFSYYMGDSITIPNSVNEGSRYLFSGYSGEVLFENSSLSTINTYMFNGYLGKSIIIPDSVTKIEDSAFVYCYNLLSVTIPSSVVNITNDFITKIKLSEIYNLSNVAIEVNGVIVYTNLGESVISIIDDYAFMNRDNEYYLISYFGDDSSVILPNDFNGNSYIIDQFAFHGKTNLYSINLGTGVKKIEMYAFNECYRLAQIINPNGIELPQFLNLINEISDSKDDGLICVDDFIFMKDLHGNYYFLDYVGNKVKVSLPTTVGGVNSYVIHSYAFYEDSNIQRVNIPYSVKSIGRYAFAYCSNLQTIFLSNDQISSIKEYAFYNCERLKEFTNMKRVNEIGLAAFSGVKISYLNIQGTYLVIPEHAFSYAKIDCLVLSGVTDIKDNAFLGASVNLYYKADEVQFNRVNMGINNQFNNLYFYSEAKPSSAGNYWYLDSGYPKLW